ncbi:MAG: DUF547 domain-containing protein [Flavobacteriaceae bacterium]|nr:DUF547 domain-containing protein [Flavobacteriaceae bacterium]
MKSLKVLFLLISTTLSAQDTSKFFDSADHFFQTYVENGKVKYAEIKRHPKALSNLMEGAKKIKVSPENPDQYKAFWIKSYNLAVISGIVKNYPVSSPMDLNGFFDKTSYEIGGKKVTLNSIENDLLRAKFYEPRFHFVLVCAAKSCPPIISEAYRPETLEEQLQRQTEKAMNNPQFVQVQKDKVLFSEIMKWYEQDFTKNGQTLIGFAIKYRKTPIPNNFETGFYKYNWKLNEF